MAKCIIQLLDIFFRTVIVLAFLASFTAAYNAQEAHRHTHEILEMLKGDE